MYTTKRPLENLDPVMLAAALDRLADAVTVHDVRGKLLYANVMAARLMGHDSVQAALEAEPLGWLERFELTDEHGARIDVEQLPGRLALAGNDPEPLFMFSFDRKLREGRWMKVRASPLRDLDGSVVAAVNIMDDVTAVKDAERRQTLLARVGEIFSRSLNYEETLSRVARLAVPGFADWCAFDLVTPDGTLDLLTVEHVDPDKVATGLELRRRYPIDQDAPGGVGTVLASGEPLLTEDVTEEMLEAVARDEEHLRLMRALGIRSALLLPLTSTHGPLGVLTLVRTERAHFSPTDIELATELARRAGLAIDHARLFTEHARIAHTLQAGLLPAALPEPASFEVAVLFRAAGTANEIGGDFYDLVALDDGWLAVVGDVVGKDATAAAVTPRARYTLAGVAQASGDLTEACARLNDNLLAQPGMPMCTAVVAKLSDAGAVELVCAGHPAPYVVRASGELEKLGARGYMLGAYADTDEAWVPVKGRLAPGDALVLFTDGVPDARNADGEHFGMERFERLLASRTRTAKDVSSRVETALGAFQDSAQRDDIAVMVLRRRAPNTVS